MQTRSSKILDGYNLLVVYSDDKEYSTLQPLFKHYGLALTNTKSNLVFVDGNAFDDNGYDNDYLDAIDAHEMAHIILGHGTKQQSQTEEMEADYFGILLLKAIGCDDAASLLIGDFSGRHGVNYEDVENQLNPTTEDKISDFMIKHFPSHSIINEADRITKEFFDTLKEENINQGKQRLVEGRVDDAKKIAEENSISEDVISVIINSSAQLNQNHKYLLWLLDQAIKNDIPNTENWNAYNQKIIEPLEYFINNSDKFVKKDIYAYESSDDLAKVVDEVKNKERRVISEMNPGDKIYEDSKIQILVPTTHAASCYYGSGTKWCTTYSNDKTYYTSYRSQGELYYVIDKLKTTADRTYKLAIRFMFVTNDVGYKIVEMRDAPDDRLVPLEEFMDCVGEDGFNAIINDLNKRHQHLIDKNSLTTLKSKYENNPKEVLEWLNFSELRVFFRYIELILTDSEIYKLLISNNISPFDKTDLNYSSYYTYLANSLGNQMDGMVEFINEYRKKYTEDEWEILKNPMFTSRNVLDYLKTTSAHWGRDLGFMVIVWYNGGCEQRKCQLDEYLNFDDVDYTDFWTEWHNIGGLLTFISNNSTNYLNYLIRAKSDLMKIFNSSLQYGSNVIDIYNVLSDIKLHGYSNLNIFEYITNHDWVVGFDKIYGENGINELIPFLIKNDLDFFKYLMVTDLVKYYGSMNNMLDSAFEYYGSHNEDDDEIINFLGEKIPLKDQLEYFKLKQTIDEDDDELLTLIKLYDTYFFDFFNIDDFMEATGHDIEFLSKVFDAANLTTLFEENVGNMRMFESFYRNSKDGDLTPEEKINYLRKAFKIFASADCRFNDNGTVDLLLYNGYNDLVDWFYDGNVGYSGSNPRYVAKSIFGEDDNFEPYDDVVQNWVDEVWDPTSNENVEHIKEYIKEKILPVEVDTDELDLDETFGPINEEGYITLTPEILDKLSKDQLGKIIDDVDEFDQLKDETKWAYEIGYNQAISSEWYEAYIDEIFSLIGGDGKPEWEKTGRINKHTYKSGDEVKTYESEEQILVIYNIKFFGIVSEWIEDNIKYENEFQYGFIDTVSNYLSENNNELTPDPSEWPNNKNTEENYNDILPGRI